MKKSAIFLFIILNLFSCTKDENPTVTPKLKNCAVQYLLLFDDLERLNSGNSFFIDPGDTSGAFYSYLYADDKMIRSTGGFVYVPSGSNFSNQMFSKNVYDSIQNEGNLIYIFTKTNFDKTIVESPYNPAIYTLDSHKRLSAIVKRDGFRPEGYSLTYTYSDNLIIETNSKGQISRKFFFENKNLVKVITEYYDPKGILGMEKEIAFMGFDDKPNPFKNMYYVNGAFYRAFSENNYKSYSIREYFVLTDGTTTPIGLYNSYAWPIEYNANDYPMFGDYE